MADSGTDYSSWNVKDLKDFLRSLNVDTSGVIEKSELVELVRKAETGTLNDASAAAGSTPVAQPGADLSAGVAAHGTSAAGATGAAAGTTGTGTARSSWGYGGYSSWYREPSPPPPEPDYASMTPEEAQRVRRSRYRCGARFVTLDKIPPFTETLRSLQEKGLRRAIKMSSRSFWSSSSKTIRLSDEMLKVKAPHDPDLNAKVSLWRGDMTHLEIDAVVNAANETLLGGGGIDGAIHDAAGPWLREECRKLHGCDTGQTKITGGHDLPAKYILHTVGPTREDPRALRSCYATCLDLVAQHGIRSVGFCCVATGIYGYPLEEATLVALRTVREWLERDDNRTKVDRIIFVVFLEHELGVYEQLMPTFFPPAGADVGQFALRETEESAAAPPSPPPARYTYSYGGYGAGGAGSGTAYP